MEEKKVVVGELADGTLVYAIEGNNERLSEEILKDALGRIINPQETQIVNMDRIVGLKSCVQTSDFDKDNVFEVVKIGQSQEKKGKPIVIKRPPESCSKVVIGLSKYQNGYLLGKSYIGDEIIPDDYEDDFWKSHAYVYDSSSIQSSTYELKLPDGSTMEKDVFEETYIYNKDAMQAQREEKASVTPSSKTLLFLVGHPLVLGITPARIRASECAKKFGGERISSSDIQKTMFPNVQKDVDDLVNTELINRSEQDIKAGKFTIVESDFAEPQGSRTVEKITDLALQNDYTVRAIIVKYIPEVLIKAAQASPNRESFFRAICEKRNTDYDRLVEQLRRNGARVDVVDNREKEEPTGPDFI